MTFFNTGSEIKRPKNLQMMTIAVTNTAVNGPVLSARNLKIINHSDSIAYVQEGTAETAPASSSSYYYIIPANYGFIVSSDDVLSGQVNVALESGSGNVDFVFSD